MKSILFCHFLSSCSMLNISVYYTSWISVTLLKGDPISRITSEQQIFSKNLSWGALTMMICTIFTIFAEVLFNSIRKFTNNKYIFILTQSFICFALIYSYKIESFKLNFIILPFLGFAFASFSNLSVIVSDFQDSNRNYNYEKMLNSTMFFAQSLMFCIFPLIYSAVSPDSDYIIGFLVSAGVCSGLASFFAIFI